MLMALSAFAANNQGAQNIVSRLLGGDNRPQYHAHHWLFQSYRFCYRCHDGTKEKQKHCFMDSF